MGGEKGGGYRCSLRSFWCDAVGKAKAPRALLRRNIYDAERKSEILRLGLSCSLVGVCNVLVRARCSYTVWVIYHSITGTNRDKPMYTSIPFHHPYLQSSAFRSASLRLDASHRPPPPPATASTALAPNITVYIVLTHYPPPSPPLIPPSDPLPLPLPTFPPFLLRPFPLPENSFKPPIVKPPHTLKHHAH